MGYIGRRPVAAGTAYLWWEGLWSLLHTFAFTLFLLYQVQVAHLTPAQLVLVGTALEATCFLFEVPTSVVADVYSRRLSALIGAVVVGLGILVQGLFPTFWVILAAQVVWGVGFTFISGAVDAWITDEVGAEAVQPLFTRFQQQSLVLRFVGIILAGLVAQHDLRLPMLLAGAGYLLLAAVMAPLMPERGFTPTPREERETFSQMRRTLATGLHAARRPGVVRAFLVIAVLTGISSEVFDRLWAARVLHELHLPKVPGVHGEVAWFTVFALVGAVISLVASLLVNRFAAERVNSLHPHGLLAGLVLVQAVGMVGFALLGSVWPALLAKWVRDAAQVVAAPVRGAWLNRNIESSARATTLSLTAQADALGQVAGGPPLGALASRTSIPVAMLVSAALLTPAAAVYARLRPNAAEAARGRQSQ